MFQKHSRVIFQGDFSYKNCEQNITKKGVNIVCGAQVKRFEGKSTVSSIVTEETTFKSDLVIVGIGILPNLELAQSAGIDCENGILVNENCQTSKKNVYAILLHFSLRNLSK